MTKLVLPIVLAAALVFTGLWGYNQYTQNRQYGIYMDNIYQKSFYELVGNVGSVENRLAKIMVSGDQSQHIILLSEISRQADAAQSDLGQLPVSHIALTKTVKYLNQLFDYSYFLNKKVSDGKTISLEEMGNLRKLHENAAQLNSDLTKLNTSILNGDSSWSELGRSGRAGFYEASKDIVTEQFVDIEKTSIDYPTLIYDGPFSETLNDKNGTELKGSTVTQAQAKDIAIKFIGNNRVSKVENTSESHGTIETWGFNIWVKDDTNNPIYTSVTKKGGKVINMIAQHVAKGTKLSINEAKKQATAFLKGKGYTDMMPTYQQQYDGLSTINFTYKKNGILMYPDLIKVKISLEDGKIFGLEARSFLIAHKERNLGVPKLSMEEARKLVNPNLKIKSSQMAVIPTESKQERFCYEFKGEYLGKTFIVYIDANTGQEANILQIIDTKNGSLAM